MKDDLAFMVDVFAACIETGIMPTHGSPCHRLARKLVDESGMKPKRKRRRLPKVTGHNAERLPPQRSGGRQDALVGASEGGKA